MNLRVFLFLFFIQLAHAQAPLPVLLDSLTQASSNEEKSRLSMVVAAQLAKEDWKRALTYIDLAKKASEKSNSEKTIADFHIALADIYSSKDALDASLEHYLTAYEFYRTQAVSVRSELENDLAVTFARTANEEKALKYFRKVYEYQKTKNDTLGLASILNNIGRVWLDKNVDSSMFYFQKSLKVMGDFQNSKLKGFLYTNLAKCYIQKNEIHLAKSYLLQALNEFKTASLPKNEAWVYDELSEFYLSKQRYDSAIYYSKIAVTTLDTLAPFSFEQYRAVGLLYKSYIGKREFENASQYFEKYLAISDTLNVEDKKVNVERLLIEEEYRNQERIRKLEESKRRSNNYIIFLSLLALLLFLGGLLYRFRNKLKRVELEKQLATAKQAELNTNLQLKNKELIGKAMVEMHRTEIIEDILNDLKEVKLKAVKKETQQAIDYIAKRLKRDTSKNIWEEFEIRFEQVHESFYKNLIKKHPDLTPKDKRLCALLKLNLTSKEIAQITGQSSKSVENARTRLRKKLNITNSQTDLSTYLFDFG